MATRHARKTAASRNSKAAPTESPSPTHPPRTRRWLCAALLIGAVVVVYSNSLWGEFHFDDDGQIVGNKHLGDLCALLGSRPPARWLTFTTFFVNYRLGGLGFMPGWHAVNIALHAACVCALYWTLTLLGTHMRHAPLPATRKRPLARPDRGTSLWPVTAALIFAVHPLAAEPVNYIQARSTTLYTLFSLLALDGTIIAHTGPGRGAKVSGIVLTLFSLLLAAFSKEVGCFFALALPGLYLLVFVPPHLQNRRRFWLMFAAALATLVVLAVVWLTATGAMEGIVRRAGARFRWHWWAQMIVFWRYLLRAALPLPSLLSVDHYVPIRAYRLADPAVLASFAALLGLVILPGIVLIRKRPVVGLLVLFIPLGLVPYFLMPSWEIMVEYRFYLPLTACCALAALPLARLIGSHRRLGLSLVSVIVVALAGGTLLRNQVWRTDVALWEDAVAKAPRKARAVNGLAWALLKSETAPDPQRALKLARRSFDPRHVDLPPGYNPFMVDTLAEAHFANGQCERAIQLEQEIIKRYNIDPAYFAAQLAKFKAARRQSRATTHQAGR